MAEYLNRHEPPNEMQARELTEMAVDEQLANGSTKVVEDALSALTFAATSMSLATKEQRQSVVNITLCASLLVDRLAARGRASVAEQVAAWFAVNQVDDHLLRGHGRYPMRMSLLSFAVNGLDKVATHVRHTDLVARFKLAIEYGASDDDVMVAEAVDHLRELVPAIESRISETADDAGPGSRPDGEPVAPERVAEREITAGPVSSMERYRSLPRLRAQVLFELGRLLTSTGLVSINFALEEAFAACEKASIAYAAVADVRWSAHAAVAAAQCLAWLADRLRGRDADNHERRLLEYGRSAHQQVLSAGLPKEQERALALLARSAYQRALWWGQLRAVQGPIDDAIKLMYRDVVVSLTFMEQLATSDPWAAMTCGAVAIRHMHDFLAWAPRLQPPPASDEERAAREAQTLETLRHYCTGNVVDALTTAMGGAFESPPPERPRDPPGAPAPDVWTPRTAPGATSLHLQTALHALLLAGAVQPAGLTYPQWELVARVAGGARPIAMSTGLVLQLRRTEGRALAASIGTLGVTTLARYVEQRVERLERHLANPVLSASERLLLSGWISSLIQWGRQSTDDFNELAPSRALALMERAGASAYRSDALVFGRSGAQLPGGPGAVHTTSFPEASTIDRVTDAWAQVHLARNLVDFWSRAKMIHEAAMVDPLIGAAFEPYLRDPPVELLAFPLDVPADELRRATGAETSECEVRSDRTVIRMQPGDLAQIDRHLGPVRRFLTVGLQTLSTMHELDIEDFQSCPAANPEVIEHWLADHPSTALLIPGPWPEEATAFNAFTHRDGALHRVRIDAGAPEAGAERVVCAMAFAHALGADATESTRASWDGLAQALDRVTAAFAPWAKATATVLRAQDVDRVVFLLRGPQSAQIPWETFPIDDQGTLFGDAFETTWAYTLAALPRCAPGIDRSGTVQVVGSGSSEAQLAAGASAMRALAEVGLAEPSLRGAELAENGRLGTLFARASRVRLFLHGHHDSINPDADRLTLVDAERTHDRVNLHPRDLRRLSLMGMECVELWACEGAAHGREFQEHGISDEPEDLTAALLVAGARRIVASRWHVPTLPSALLLELHALNLARGLDDVRALAAARREYRSAFAIDGPIERAFVATLTAELERLVVSEAGLRHEQRDAAVMRAYHAAIDEQRVAWYRGASVPAPRSPLDDRIVVDYMAKAMPGRSERIASTLGQGSDHEVRAIIDDILQMFRAPAAWCGWRVTARDLSAI
ncbi:MAG: CHAT domain-containing protein [Kofleriaceae bacterium]